MNSSATSQQFDVIIVGGGMVGAAAACGVADLGLSVAVIEQRKPQRTWPADEIDLRVSAISRASQNLLENLGAWHSITAYGAMPYREMRVWDSLSLGDIHFDSADIGEPDLGHIIQNRSIQAGLWDAMEQRRNIHIVSPATIIDLRLEQDGAKIYLEDGETLQGEIVVGADGANSKIRGYAGIAESIHDFNQYGVVATVTVPEGHRNTAWQHFLQTGPLAFLPIAKDKCSIVWSTTPEQSEQLIEMDDEQFLHLLSEAIQSRLGPITETSVRARFQLRSKQSSRYIGNRLALAGDAAHQIHPLAGQGVNLGFRDAATLVDTLANAKTKQQPIGSTPVLRRYERSRRGDNIVTQKSMEAFNAIFSNNVLPLRALRNIGLAMTEHLPPAKNFFMHNALGLTGEVPPLCKTRFGDDTESRPTTG